MITTINLEQGFDMKMETLNPIAEAEGTPKMKKP